MNWAVGNGWVILVGFDNPTTDNAAKALLESWYPGRDVHVIEMLDSWVAGGGGPLPHERPARASWWIPVPTRARRGLRRGATEP